MAAFSGYSAIGGALIEGVLTELPGMARRPIAGDITGSTITLSQSITFGPFAADTMPLGAFVIFSGAGDGTPLLTASMPGLIVRARQFLSFPSGVFVMTPGAPISPNVLTINGVPLMLNGDLLQIG